MWHGTDTLVFAWCLDVKVCIWNLTLQLAGKPARSTPEAFRRLAGGKRRRTRRHRLGIVAITDPGRGRGSRSCDQRTRSLELDVVDGMRQPSGTPTGVRLCVDR